MTLIDAWEKRKELWARGTELIVEGNQLWKELATMPASGALRVGVWFSLSEMSCDAAAKVSKGYALRMDADQIWADALLEAKGTKTKLVWVFDDMAKAYTCILEDGQEFKA